jgi:hypothetical protein
MSRVIGIAVGSALALICAGLPNLAAQEGFKRFPETISPDGAYVLAWGAGAGPEAESIPKMAELTEVDFNDTSFDKANSNDTVANFLVDLRSGRAVAWLSGFEYWAGPEFHRNRADLEVAWRADSKAALAIFDGRWGSEAVAWIEPEARRVVDVRKQFEKAFGGVLRKAEPKFPRECEMRFWNAVLLDGGVLVVDAAATIPKEQDTSDYRLKFKVDGAGEKIRFLLQGSRKLPQNDDSGSDDAEAELNKVYAKLRGTLSEEQRKLLTEQQRTWLQRRDEITNDNSKEAFTKQRINNLRTRLELK